MDEKYEKLYTYGKNLAQDIEKVTDYFYQALQADETEKQHLEQNLAATQQELIQKRNELQAAAKKQDAGLAAAKEKVTQKEVQLDQQLQAANRFMVFLQAQQERIEKEQQRLRSENDRLQQKGQKLNDQEQLLQEKQAEFERKAHKKEKIKELEEDNANLREELTKIGRKLSKQSQEISNLQEQLKQKETEKQQLSAAAEEKIRELQAERNKWRQYYEDSCQRENRSSTTLNKRQAADGGIIPKDDGDEKNNC